MGFTGAKYYIDEDRPELVELFKDKSEAHIPCNSKKMLDLICPCCGRLYHKTPYQICRNVNIYCDMCNDGYSLPEKYVMNILKQLNIDFTYQYTSEWTENFRYDFKFEYNNSFYIIETDGGIGHGNKVYKSDKRTLEKTLAIDNEKDLLAKKNNHIMIRINCNYGHDKYGFLKEHCIKSLSEYFDLSKINWQECEQSCVSSKFSETIACYKNTTKYVDKIAEIVGIKPRTIVKYLTEAMEIGIVPEEVIINHYIMDNDLIVGNKPHITGKIVYCYEDDLYFNTIADAAKYYKFNRSSFGHAINNSIDGYYKSRHFCFVTNKDEIAKFREGVKNSNLHKDKKIYQYDKNKNLINCYNSASNLPKEFSYGVVYKVCTKQQYRKTAYGYIWSYEPL